MPVFNFIFLLLKNWSLTILFLMENRIDIFEVKEPAADPVRTMTVSAVMTHEGCHIQRNISAGTAFQNLKLAAMCINALAETALVDLEKLECVSFTAHTEQDAAARATHETLEDLRDFLTTTRDASAVLAEMLKLGRGPQAGA